MAGSKTSYPGATGPHEIDNPEGVGCKAYKITLADTTHTLTAAESGALFVATHASGCTVTVPDGLPENFQCAFFAKAATAITLTWSGSDTVTSKASNVKIAASGGSGSLVKDTATTWVLAGDLTA